MKFSIERSDAFAAVTRVSGVVAKKGTIPILGHVKIEARDGSVTFTGTDLDIESTASVAGTVEVAGAVTMDGSRLREVVAAAPQGAEIVFDATAETDPRVTVKYGRSRFRVPSLAAADFPVMATVPKSVAFEVDSASLAAALTQVSAAASTEIARYYLCGVFVHVVGDRLTFVATNGHTLAVDSIPVPDGAAKIPGVIVSSKTVAEIIKLCGDNLGPVTMIVGQSGVGVDVGSQSIRSKVIDGNYPDYARVIPKDVPHVVRFAKSDMATAIKRATIAADDLASTVVFNVSAGKITVEGRGLAEAADEIEAEYDGPDARIAASAFYCVAALARASGTVEVGFSGEVDPMIWREAGDTESLTIVMPLRA